MDVDECCATTVMMAGGLTRTLCVDDMGGVASVTAAIVTATSHTAGHSVPYTRQQVCGCNNVWCESSISESVCLSVCLSVCGYRGLDRWMGVVCWSMDTPLKLCNKLQRTQ